MYQPFNNAASRPRLLVIAAFAAGLFTFSSLSVSAQDQRVQRSPEERAERQTQHMQRRLRLSAEQRGKVYEINLFYARQRDEIKDMPQGPERKEDSRAVHRDKNADLKAALTGDQFQEYIAMQQEQQQKRMQRKEEMR